MKIVNKMEIEVTFFNIVKTTYHKPTANIMVNREKLKVFYLSRHEVSLSIFNISIQYVL